MTKYQAHALLNQHKLGMCVSPSQVNEALFMTGDLDVLSIAPKVDRPLLNYGLESCYVRSGEASCLTAREVRVRVVGGNSNANQGAN